MKKILTFKRRFKLCDVAPMGGAVAGTVRRGHRRDGKADAAAADGGQHQLSTL